MKPLSALRFDALAGYSRSPLILLGAHELEWYEEADEKLLGVISQDIQDKDYVATVLGRDAMGRFRGYHVEINLASLLAARTYLAGSLAELAQLPVTAFHQGHFRDPDGNFVEQFQSSAFDARLWELYLYALFTELGYAFDRSHAAPDYHCGGLRGTFFVEATSVNPSAKPPVIDVATQEAYFAHYVPIKFGSALFSKLQKRYWELEHVSGHPLVFALQDFHAPRAMVWSNTGLVEYLYGIRQTEKKVDEDRSEIVSEPIDAYEWEGKKIPAGFFLQPDTEHISAVLANPGGTSAKFNRMGFLAGFGDHSLRMVRGGICYKGKLVPESYSAEVHAPDYKETWCEGVSIYHNPRARHPLPESAIPGAAHHTSDGKRVLSHMPPFFPIGTNTAIVVPT